MNPPRIELIIGKEYLASTAGHLGLSTSVPVKLLRIYSDGKCRVEKTSIKGIDYEIEQSQLRNY